MLDDDGEVAVGIDYPEVGNQDLVIAEVEDAALGLRREARLAAAPGRRSLQSLNQLGGLLLRNVSGLGLGDVALAAPVGHLAHGEVEMLAARHAEREIGDDHAGLAAVARGNGHVAYAAARQRDGVRVHGADIVAADRNGRPGPTTCSAFQPGM